MQVVQKENLPLAAAKLIKSLELTKQQVAEKLGMCPTLVVHGSREGGRPGPAQKIIEGLSSKVVVPCFLIVEPDEIPD